MHRLIDKLRPDYRTGAEGQFLNIIWCYKTHARVDRLLLCLQEEDKGRLLATLKGGAKADAIAPAHSTTGTGNVGKSVNVMSMSVSLGGKAVPFGKAAGGKKTRKKKTEKKKQKNITRNYDDEGVGLA